MSYNGIGLSTVRGSSTNGYVTRNLGHVRVSDAERRRAAAVDGGAGGGGAPRRSEFAAAPVRQANAAILAHDAKRRIALRKEELRAELEEGGGRGFAWQRPHGWVRRLSSDKGGEGDRIEKSTQSLGDRRWSCRWCKL